MALSATGNPFSMVISKAFAFDAHRLSLLEMRLTLGCGLNASVVGKGAVSL